MTGMTDVSEGPNEPRKYEIMVESFKGLPRGDTVILDKDDWAVRSGLKAGAIRLLNEPASEYDSDN